MTSALSKAPREDEPTSAPTRAELARTVAEIVIEADDLIDAFAAGLPADCLAPVLVRATEIRRALQRLENAVRLRFATEVAVKAEGLGYMDEDGARYVWRGDRKRSWDDIPTFLGECRRAGMSERDIFDAVSDLRVTPFTESGISAVAHALVEHRRLRTSTPNLVKVDDE